ncbi:hypothetical protein N7475_000326 [Penicillium sp. IBT 31633x]|nr:hypothetical protein N7475_000326 [Penicillium sp. IBT 31633x]
MPDQKRALPEPQPKRQKQELEGEYEDDQIPWKTFELQSKQYLHHESSTSKEMQNAIEPANEEHIKQMKMTEFESVITSSLAAPTGFTIVYFLLPGTLEVQRSLKFTRLYCADRISSFKRSHSSTFGNLRLVNGVEKSMWSGY